MNWFYSKDGQQVGPVPFADIERLLTAGELTEESLVWQEGTPTWVKLSTIKPAAPVETAAPGAPPLPAVTPVTPASPSTPVTVTTTLEAPIKTNTLAIVALVLGILGLFCCGVLVGAGAVVCGFIALKQIKENPLQPGKNLALAGIITGGIAIILHAIFFILYGAAYATQISQGMQQ